VYLHGVLRPGGAGRNKGPVDLVAWKLLERKELGDKKKTAATSNAGEDRKMVKKGEAMQFVRSDCVLCL